jgi:hypothetical protein
MFNCWMDFWRPLFILCGRWVRDVCLMAFKPGLKKRIEGRLCIKAGDFFLLKNDRRYTVRNFSNVHSKNGLS